MIGQESLLVTLVRLVNRLPLPPSPLKRRRGRPKTYLRSRKTRSWRVALCVPARISQVVMVAWPCPNTRTAAATSSPSARAVSTSPTRTDAVLSR